MPTLQTAFLLQHVHGLPDGEEDVKVIGVYSSQAAAEEAVERLRTQPGFAEAGRLVDPETSDDVNGFYIDEYELDRDHWTEGFVTV